MSQGLSVSTVPDIDPCRETGCAMLSGPIETCRDHRCPIRWQREAREDRVEREEKDARIRAGEEA